MLLPSPQKDSIEDGTKAEQTMTQENTAIEAVETNNEIENINNEEPSEALDEQNSGVSTVEVAPSIPEKDKKHAIVSIAVG